MKNSADANKHQCIYVTGAAGFIGTHTTKILTGRGYRVVGIDLLPLGRSGLDGSYPAEFVNSPCTFHALTEISSRYGLPTAIIHCAGSASVPASFDDPRADFLANVSTTADVLEFARCKRDIRIVFPSSAAVYGSVLDIPIREDSTPLPISPYGVHKLIAEQLCRSYGASFGVPGVCIRLFSVYGAGLRKQLLWDACNKAVTGRFEFYGTGEELRDWLHVLDAARLLGIAIDWASPKWPTVNGGTGTGLSIRDILTRLGSKWKPGLCPVFSGQERRGDPSHFVADTMHIRQMGFSPSVDLDKALGDYVAWYRKECEV